MTLEGEQTLLRVHLRNTDRHGWFSPPAAEELVRRARSAGMAGATVLRGILGLDVTGKLLETCAWSLVDHVPVVVEIVDGSRPIGRFLSVVEAVVAEGLATLERAHVLVYRHGQAAAEKAADAPGRAGPDRAAVHAAVAAGVSRHAQERERPVAARFHRRLRPVGGQAALPRRRDEGPRAGAGRSDGAARADGFRGQQPRPHDEAPRTLDRPADHRRDRGFGREDPDPGAVPGRDRRRRG